MRRRDFLSIFMQAPLLGYSLEMWIKKEINKDLHFTENELVGITAPTFCGDFQLRCETAEAFAAMAKEAKKDGLSLWCTSGYREFDYQKNLWNHKYKSFGKTIHKKTDIITEIIKYTSLPGTSRHHWGTDLDITDALGYTSENSLSVENYQEGGEYQYLKYWLDKNAIRYGFYEVYTNNEDRTGFKYEPWHYSYAPLSRPMLAQLLTVNLPALAELKECLGYEYFTKKFLDAYIKNYVLGINPALLP